MGFAYSFMNSKSLGSSDTINILRNFQDAPKNFTMGV